MAGDRAYYSLKADRVVLPERSQFPSQDTSTYTALHELGHATGHADRLNRPALVNHGGFGTETYAREELRAEIAAMMTGEQLGVGHEPRHGTAYVSSWIKARENDPKEIRATAVDAQRISDWLLSRERERSLGDEKSEPEQPEGAAGSGGRRGPAGGAGVGDAGPVTGGTVRLRSKTFGRRHTSSLSSVSPRPTWSAASSRKPLRSGCGTSTRGGCSDCGVMTSLP